MLAEVALELGATPYQVALAFLLRLPNVLAIPKAASAAHVTENGKAGDLVLTEAQQHRIGAALPVRRVPPRSRCVGSNPP